MVFRKIHIYKRLPKRITDLFPEKICVNLSKIVRVFETRYPPNDKKCLKNSSFGRKNSGHFLLDWYDRILEVERRDPCRLKRFCQSPRDETLS